MLEALGKKNDTLIAISTSGNSKNIVKVLKKAQLMKINTICFLGKGGGIAKKFSKNNIIVNSNSTARIQESHICIGPYNNGNNRRLYNFLNEHRCFPFLICHKKF